MDLSIGFGQLCKDQDFSLRGVLVLLYGYHTSTDFSTHIVYAVCDTQFTGRLNNDSKENCADYILFAQGKLPDYYITRAEAIALGWKSSKPLAKYAPGKMLFGGIYLNEDGLLPSAPGRIWYEADINYYSGRRNSHRILFSNDGLVFVSYDHCRTFYEII